jgi:hypothetical protein
VPVAPWIRDSLPGEIRFYFLARANWREKENAMAQDFGTPVTPPPPDQPYAPPPMGTLPPKRNNTLIIVIVVIVVILLCCCCLAALAYWFYNYGGDQLISNFSSVLPALLSAV